MFAAKTLGRPVRWIGTRSEAFIADAHARDQQARGELAVDENGRFLAFRVSCAASLGAYLSSYGVGTITSSFAKMAGHVYRIPRIHVHVEGFLTHTAPTDAYRGAGTPEMVYLLERLIERAAAELGIDRIELRRRNLVTPAEYPYKNPVGRVYQDGDFPAVFDAALRMAKWDTFEERRTDAHQRGKRLGIGVAPYVKVTAAEPGGKCRGGAAIGRANRDPRRDPGFRASLMPPHLPSWSVNGLVFRLSTLRCCKAIRISCHRVRGPVVPRH